MPKKVYKINNFHGGLNNSSDPRDVDDKEITASTNVMVDEVGRVRLTGKLTAHDAPALNNTGAGFTDATCDYNFSGVQDPTVTCNANTDIGVGMGVSGSLIPTNAYIVSVTEGGGAGTGVTTFELNGNTDAGSEVTNGTLRFITQTPGSGLFYFSHDRKGGEDAGDDEEETADNYLALYDDSDVQVWIYSLATDDWDDDKDSNENGVINFLGKTTSAAARPCFFSVDGAVRVSTGEFSKYASGSLINDGSHFLTSETSVDIDTGSHLSVGNYVQIDDEVLYVTNVSSNTITFRRGIFGTKITQHDDDSIVYILNMNQWYGYLNNKLFQTSTGSSVYDNNKWYNNIQHLRSLDDLGITLALHDATSTSPAAGQINAVNKIVVAYWFTTTAQDVGFWNGTYWIGLTPVYEGGQEGPISTVGTSPLQINEEILNIQLYITHPDIDDTAIVEGDGHPLLDERIIGLKLYTKNYTSDEWFLLKEFDLLEGGEHGWETYNSDAGANITSGGGNTLTGFWKTTSTADSLTLAAPTTLGSYDGAEAATNTTTVVNTCTATLNLEESKGSGRVGTLRLSGFDNSPLYLEVDLSSTSSQAKAFNVINPAAGTHKFVVELLDENLSLIHISEPTRPY